MRIAETTRGEDVATRGGLAGDSRLATRGQSRESRQSILSNATRAKSISLFTLTFTPIFSRWLTFHRRLRASTSDDDPQSPSSDLQPAVTTNPTEPRPVFGDPSCIRRIFQFFNHSLFPGFRPQELASRGEQQSPPAYKNLRVATRGNFPASRGEQQSPPAYRIPRVATRGNFPRVAVNNRALRHTGFPGSRLAEFFRESR
ncbi:aspartyl/glutamyl-tRNA(Asn/Gln) amidotransferasesubunit B [Striga asiatica]|uniref:Aspartyl/glutamyl-tRNA(Asn/Gln) amidotransferasesubunit B n=1 Tax=Striga asiatica TaxID=4170 RepID=A0A5A7QQ31_STRAF|nr:aspartyl/glutamyl-tRNA(Asn/Gln) amidotransferasesubunit B [Striga asiatica]